MIRFRPRDIGMWRGKFNFPPKMIPLPDFKEFDSPQEFLDFLIENDVRLNDPDNKLLLLCMMYISGLALVAWKFLALILSND